MSLPVQPLAWAGLDLLHSLAAGLEEKHPRWEAVSPFMTPAGNKSGAEQAGITQLSRQ